MTLFSQLSRGSNVEIGSEMEFSSLVPGVKVVERFGTWRLKLAEGRPLRISGENYFCHVTLYPQYFQKTLMFSSAKYMVVDHKQEIISSQVDVEGIVVENLARRCGGFLKSLSLNGCQVNIHQNLINTISSWSSGSGWLCPVNVCSALQQHRATEP